MKRRTEAGMLNGEAGRSRRKTASEQVGPYECGPLGFKDASDIYDRHVIFDHSVRLEAAGDRERFEGVARTLRDVLTQRWLLTEQVYAAAGAKRVYYLSMEFLIGRTLINNIVNMRVEEFVRDNLRSDPNQNWTGILEAEPDAGLGNGGLGRLAACFLDSLATLAIPAMGYGLRYEYGIFRQEIQNGYQVEHPDHWLRFPDPWEVRRPQEIVRVPLGCSFGLENGRLRAIPGRSSVLLGVPYDRPIVGFGGKNINTLRLWAAGSPETFSFGEFSSGNFVEAVVEAMSAETVTRVLYPDDSNLAGQALRFIQEYFLVCCSVGDIVGRFRRAEDHWEALPDRVAVQMNDTHPAMAVAEFMRILLDDAHLAWESAWELTLRTLAYTNHTLLPEALERWPVRFFELVCPRLLEIIYEINRRFLISVQQRYAGDDSRVQRMSLIEESASRQVRMANLAIVGTHSTNGVAEIHSQLIRTQLVPDFAAMFPERFNNKTNGVTPRRWMLLANPSLASLLTDAIGDGWISDLAELRKIMPLAADAVFRQAFRETKQNAKAKFAEWLKLTTGQVVDPASIFDSQIKRIHEYKRQLLNVLHIVTLYNQLRVDPETDIPPRTFFFAGKAAPAYALAKLIIKLINEVAATIDADPVVRGRLKVVFVPNYGVTLAERLIPASDVSEQISTAGYEASGTSNMKFMMNGALTIGTRDGATIEMAEQAGEENFFLFGLTEEQVASSRRWYDPLWHYHNEPETRAALDLIFSDHFSHNEPGVFNPLKEMLLMHGDYYMHLADLRSYSAAQAAVGARYSDKEAWTRMAIANVACSGKFSSDRTISEYAANIWDAQAVSVK